MYDGIRFITGGRFTSRGEWRHPDRSISDTELIIAIKGSFGMVVGDTEYRMMAGDILRIDPGVRHYGVEAVEEEVSFYWVHFVGAEENELPPEYFHPDSVAQAELLTRQLLHYASDEAYPRESADCLTRLLIMELKTEEARSGAENHRLFSAIKEWVRNNCDMPLRVSDAAEHFRYNEDYLNRVFRRFYPAGLKAYIDEQKMQRIKTDLLEQTDSLAEIAARYGFSDYKYFLKYFKYHEGVSPTAYRRAYCNLHTNNR